MVLSRMTRVAAITAAWLLPLLACVACAGHQDPGGPGEDCYRDSDCRAGLVCVADTSGARTCSDDVSGLVGNVEGPPPPPADAGTTDLDAGSDGG